MLATRQAVRYAFRPFDVLMRRTSQNRGAAELEDVYNELNLNQRKSSKICELMDGMWCCIFSKPHVATSKHVHEGTKVTDNSYFF